MLYFRNFIKGNAVITKPLCESFVYSLFNPVQLMSYKTKLCEEKNAAYNHEVLEIIESKQ